MKTLRVILWIVVVLVLALVLFLAYMGYFGNVQVSEQKMGPYTIAYESYMGEYKNTGTIFNKVNTLLKSASIESSVGLGIYYDDPSKVAKDKLRSECGSVISDKDAGKASKLDKMLKVKRIDAKQCMVVEFPLKNMMSIILGTMKAYPELGKYAQAKGYKMSLSYEVYDMKANKIFYVMEIKK